MIPNDPVKDVKNIENLRKSLEFVLLHEGGYVSDVNDPGGETKWGISKRAYPNEDIKNLTRERALEIYAQDYWLKAGCDDIPFPYCTVVLDSAVNCGVARSQDWLRKAKNSNEYLSLRKEYYLDTVKNKPNLQRYSRGWWNRVADLQKFVNINDAANSA